MKRCDRPAGDVHSSGGGAPEAHRRLQELVREREVEREYLALVVGRPRSRAGRIEAPIGRDRRDRVRHSLDTDTPRAAVTHFELEELLDGYALLRVRLETGRTHQIRVHLEAIELPVAGDPTYGRAACSAWSGSSSTQRASPSRIRSRAPRSTSRRRSHRISPQR